jgi:hypothetical protein
MTELIHQKRIGVHSNPAFMLSTRFRAILCFLTPPQAAEEVER